MLRDEETIRRHARQSLMSAVRSLTVKGDATIAVMVIEKVTESLATHFKAEVRISSCCGRGSGEIADNGKNLASTSFESSIRHSTHGKT